jgi:predicted nuclease of restriction endonuclease-like (RecB) superfamily
MKKARNKERDMKKKAAMVLKKSVQPASGKVSSAFYKSISTILHAARSKAYRAVNYAMVEAYWNVGRMIVEEEQQGQKRAGYGDALIRGLSERLTGEFGKGFSEQSMRNFRQFYLSFPICSTLRSELTWSHYKCIIRVESPQSRQWYMNEAAGQNWSTRALERQISSLCYERLIMSRSKKPVLKEMREKTVSLADKPEDFIKDPYVLEFLGMKESSSFRESDLERSIIAKLQAFMLELGKGFAFVARQQRISTETSDFFVDLVFYNYILKCFVLIDLKTGKLTHQDIGQMDMYVRLYEDKFKGESDNPTIGIILCTEKDETVVKYSMLKESKQLFASKYRLYLPSEKELIEEIEREKVVIVREREEIYGL